MGDWEFISDEERQESSRKARRPPLTYARIGQIAGGAVACWLTAAVCFLAFWLRWKFDPRQIAVSGTLCLGALYAGAWVGQWIGAVFDRKRDDRPKA
ncbi:hypothetical protein J0H58_36395 [bacterium]|nr:hypothetical protein [bacterium]